MLKKKEKSYGTDTKVLRQGGIKKRFYLGPFFYIYGKRIANNRSMLSEKMDENHHMLCIQP